MPEALIQPQGYAGLNPSSRFAMAAHAIVSGASDLNLANGTFLDKVGTFDTIQTDAGKALSFRRNGYVVARPDAAIGTQPFVLFWYGYVTDFEGVYGNGGEDKGQPTFATGSTNNTNAILTRAGDNAGSVSENWGSYYHFQDSTNLAAPLTKKKLTTLIVAYTEHGFSEWVDGVKVSSADTGFDAASSDRGTGSFMVGAFVEGQFWYSSSDTVLAGRAILTMSDEELSYLGANPFSLFESGEENEVFAGSYTLTAGSAAFSLSAGNVRLAAARKLATASAGYSLSGLPAALATRRMFAALTTAFTLTAAAAKVTTARRLPAASGTFGLTVGVVSLKSARRIPAGPGDVSISGGTTNLVAARRLTAPLATFAFAGGSINFTYTPKSGGQGPTYTLTGGAGAYLLSTTAARLLLARRMVAAAGAFSAAGTPVAVLAARRLPAGVASFAMAGTAAGLRAARRLPGSAASFSLSGGTATFFYAPIGAPTGPTYTLTAVGGALGLTGTAVSFRAARHLAAGVAQFTVAGNGASLAYGQRVVYARAPNGPGYASQHHENQHRPAATQRNNR